MNSRHAFLVYSSETLGADHSETLGADHLSEILLD
jgi:hypothetical protein